MKGIILLDSQIIVENVEQVMKKSDIEDEDIYELQIIKQAKANKKAPSKKLSKGDQVKASRRNRRALVKAIVIMKGSRL